MCPNDFSILGKPYLKNKFCSENWFWKYLVKNGSYFAKIYKWNSQSNPLHLSKKTHIVLNINFVINIKILVNAEKYKEYLNPLSP